MMSGPALRAVVFDLEDLPAGDRRHILDVASRLRLPLDERCFRTPLVLTRAEEAPPAPGLRDDVALADGGPSLLLLAMRLLLADAYHWPEHDWLTPVPTAATEYTLYAADPLRWDLESLAAVLGARGAVQRGLQRRDGRPPVAAGDRVPLLGFQVPVLGSQGSVRDWRPPEARPHRFGGVAVPLGLMPASATGRFGLFVQVTAARRAGDQVEAEVDLLRVDGACGEAVKISLSLGLSEPSALAEEEDVLAGVSELMPGCALVTPRGEVLLLDLHRLGMRLLAREGTSRTRVCGVVGAAGLASEEEGPELLDPLLWEAPVLAGMLQSEETQVSADGGLVALRFTGARDGAAVDTYLVLAGAEHKRPVAWAADLLGPAPGLALGERGLVVLAPGRAGEWPLSAACVSEAEADELLEHPGDLLLLRAEDGAGADAGGQTLRLEGRVSLPEELRRPGAPGVYILPGGRTVLCYQAAGRLYCAVEVPEGAAPRVRPATAADVRAALLSGGGPGLARLLRAVAAADPADDEVPALGFLGSVGEFARAGEALDVAALLKAPAEVAAEVVLRRYLRAATPRTWTAAGARALEGE